MSHVTGLRFEILRLFQTIKATKMQKNVKESSKQRHTLRRGNCEPISHVRAKGGSEIYFHLPSSQKSSESRLFAYNSAKNARVS